MYVSIHIPPNIPQASPKDVHKQTNQFLLVIPKTNHGCVCFCVFMLLCRGEVGGHHTVSGGMSMEC